MNRTVYTLGLRALAPLVWLWMARRARRAGGEWGIFSPERFGRAVSGATVPDRFAPGKTGATAAIEGPVWVHAVSLGETRAAQPLLQALLDRGLPVLLTHITARC